MRFLFSGGFLFTLVVYSFTTYAQFPENLKNIESNEQVETPTPQASAPQVMSGGSASFMSGHMIGLGIGQTFLSGGYKKNGENKIAGDLFYSYGASASFDLLVGAHYGRYRREGKKINLPGITSSIKARLYQYDSFAPFVVAGLGLYRPNGVRDLNGVSQKTKTKTTFGYNLGTGADLKLNDKFMVGFMWQFHNPFGVDQPQGGKLRGTYHRLMITGFYGF